MHNAEAEIPLVFDCGGHELLGILHRGDADATRGVLIVVGGPQYRIGSHRQFVLLARRLALEAIPVLRFDCRGMGDSEGDLRSFEAIQPDIRAAIDVFFARLPQLQHVVLWGLCDAASACAIYAPKDSRVCGLVLVNPWVRTEAGEARAYLRHYYLSRLASPSFWRKALSGKLDLRGSLRSLGGFLRRAKAPTTETEGAATPNGGPAPTRRQASTNAEDSVPSTPLPERMHRGLRAFSGRVLLILSGNDMTAREFADLCRSERAWRRWVAEPAVTRRDLPEADHTFSSAPWRGQVEDWTLAWMRD